MSAARRGDRPDDERLRGEETGPMSARRTRRCSCWHTALRIWLLCRAASPRGQWPSWSAASWSPWSSPSCCHCPRCRSKARLHLLSLLKLVALVADYLVLSSFQVAWMAIRPGPPPLVAVLRAHLALKSDLVLALAVNIFNLIPGSIVLEIDQARRILYIHLIDVGSDSTVQPVLPSGGPGRTAAGGGVRAGQRFGNRRPSGRREHA